MQYYDNMIINGNIFLNFESSVNNPFCNNPCKVVNDMIIILKKQKERNIRNDFENFWYKIRNFLRMIFLNGFVYKNYVI